MDRRDFLKSGLAGAIAVSTAGPAELLAQEVRAGVIVPGEKYSDGKAGDVSNGVEEHLNVKGYVRERSHKIPVVEEVDVVVVGGGSAGVSAAVCAAREGASVLLVEKANFLGGLWTGGLVLPVLATHGKGKTKDWDKVALGYCSEICDTLFEMDAAIRPLNPVVDPEAAKYLLDKSIYDAGVKILYNATAAGVTMSSDRIESILIDCVTGRIAIKCKFVIDASGDGLVFNWTGDPHEARRYHMSSSYRSYGSDSKKAGMATPIEGVRFATVGTRDAIDGLDVFLTSATQQQHRFKAWEKFKELRKDPDCPKAYLMEMAPVTGIRVTRVLDSMYNVTLEESMEWTSYPDVIGMSGVCDPFEYKGRWITKHDRPVWQIPYRALIPKQTKNLLVAGRCFGYDQGITWDAREISTCMVTGQAAGTAAALSVADRCASSELDVKKLQSHLRKAGVRLDF